MSEWTEWAKQFEYSPEESHFDTFHEREIVDEAESPATCLYAAREYSHRVACGNYALHRSKDDYPACSIHKYETIRTRWKGFVKGA